MSRTDMSRAWKECPISTFFATGLGIGMIPFAPGTWGSLEGLAIAALIDARFEAGFLLIVLKALAVFLLGVYWSGRSEAAADSKDPGPIVIDEVAGQLLASAPCALSGLPHSVWLWIASFALFRLFDVWKPGPIRKIQDLPGGWGIMLDDVAAGVLAGAITYGIGRVI
ncbi:MAG: phosphatidylglycerophosphatase A family protein [Thermoanaerobaculia bacterium]